MPAAVSCAELMDILEDADLKGPERAAQLAGEHGVERGGAAGQVHGCAGAQGREARQ